MFQQDLRVKKQDLVASPVFASCRLYIVGVTDQLVHQHISKDRYLQTSQMLETEVTLLTELFSWPCAPCCC